MSVTPTYIVSNPSAGTIYYAPNGYWVVPANATSVTCTVQAFNSSGGLIAVSTLDAYVHNQSNNSNPGFFSGSPSDTTNAATSTGTNGSNVFTAGGSFTGTAPASIRMYLTYTGTTYDQPPVAPGSLTPSGTVTTLTPTFTGTFSDPSPGDTLAQYEIQVVYPAGAQIWDSGIVTASPTETSNATFSKTYNGVALSFGSGYWWRARVANQNGNWGPWSGWVVINLVQGPNAPSAIVPTGLVASVTPAFSFVYSSPTSLNMQSYTYNLYLAGTTTSIYNHTTTVSAVSGATVSGTIPSAAGLVPGKSYTITFVSQDTNSANSPAASATFNVAALPQVAPASPINNVLVNTHTPTFTWSYTDPNYPQASYQLQVYNATTNALIHDTGTVSSAATSYVLSGASIAFNTPISWRIQVTDTGGLGSGYSAYAFATVIDAPQASITAPTNGATITSNTPTITWTYTASSGGQAQASASILLADSNGNALQTYTVTGAATNFTLPVGVLVNDTTYQLTISVTDTASNTGTSATNTFTLQYTPPADMQGQALTAGKNFAVSPYLNSDSDASGIVDNWSAGTITPGSTIVYSLDGSITQPTQQANGDGPVLGAQKISVNGLPSGGTYVEHWIDQFTTIATAGWIVGTTVLSASALVQIVTSGNLYAYIALQFFNSTYTYISRVNSIGTVSGNTAGLVALTGPQNVAIPAGAAYVEMVLVVGAPTASDLGAAWFCEAQLESVVASTAFMAGDMGTGYAYDPNSYSVRTLLAGNLPNLTANPGAATDPVTANGGTITIGWDTTLADATRFVAYIVERRRQDLQSSDAAWVTIATITAKAQTSYTDYLSGGNLIYQYSIRQQITYTDGSSGLSAHRAIVIGAVNYSPAWYLVTTSGLIYNMRFNVVDVKRKLAWKESAVYQQFLGRLGQARDAGPALGYTIDLVTSYDDTFGDVRPAIRRQLVAMQELNVLWYLKDPEGLVIPCYLQDFDMDEEDFWSDTLLTVTITFTQAQDTPDY